MRYLFTAFPGSSVTFPMVPLAHAAEAAGHDVLFATSGLALSTAAGAGLHAIAVDDGESRRLYDEIQVLTTEKGSNADFKSMASVFAGVGAAMAEGLVDVGRTWEADAVVYTPGHAVGLLAARVLGVPAVLQGSGIPHPTFKDALDHMLPVAQRMGVAELPEADVQIDVSPPSLEPIIQSLPERGLSDPTADWGLSTPKLPMRFCSYSGGATMPRWVLERGPRPRVVTTAGIVPNAFFGEEDSLMRDIVLGTEGLGIELLVTTADAELSGLPSPLPEHVTPVDWVPMRALLATCDGIIHHGGMSTTYTAFATGVPQLVVPGIADAGITSRVTVKRGAGATLEMSGATATTVGAAVEELLSNRSYREASLELAAEMRAMPEPGTVIDQVTELVGNDVAQPPQPQAAAIR